MNKIGICTDCICDLPEDYLKSNGIDVMHFYIHTATGRFRDGEEISSENILEYLENGEAIVSSNIPEPEEYRDFYLRILTRYDEVIHIATSDKIGFSYRNATAAIGLLGENAKRVTLIDSGSVSSGMGHMVRRAVLMRDSGSSAAEIVKACEDMKVKISATFIVPNADYLYRMKKVNRVVRDLSRIFHIHPVLYTKNGKLTVKSFRAGNYEKAVMQYVKSEFKHGDKIDKGQLFITHAGSPAKIISRIRAASEDICRFDKVTVTKASAAISSNCGPQTVGVLFVYQ